MSSGTEVAWAGAETTLAETSWGRTYRQKRLRNSALYSEHCCEDAFVYMFVSYPFIEDILPYKLSYEEVKIHSQVNDF